MVRLPALRGKLPLLCASDDTARDLCDAYDEATEMLALLRYDPLSDKDLNSDYESVCAGIESEILRLCTVWDPDAK